MTEEPPSDSGQLMDRETAELVVKLCGPCQFFDASLALKRVRGQRPPFCKNTQIDDPWVRVQAQHCEGRMEKK